MTSYAAAAAVALLTLAGGVAGAAGLDAAYECDYEVVQQDDVTGYQHFAGAAAGYVADTAASPVAIRCYIMVNGAEAWSTPTGSGTAYATTAGLVSYVATDEDQVDRCAEVTTSQGTFGFCYGPDS